MNGGQQIGMPWISLLGFLRLSTNRTVRKPPLSMNEALLFVEEWLEWETVWIPEPTARHATVLRELLVAVPRSAMVSDAHLAALSIEHGLTLCSADVGLKMFPGLKLHNPFQ